MKKSRRWFTFILVPLDYLAVLTTFLLAYFLRDYLNEAFIIPFAEFYLLAIFLSLFWLFTFAWMGLYDFSLRRGSLEELLKIVFSSAAALTLNLSVIFLSQQFAFSRFVLILTWIGTVILLWFYRNLLGLVERYYYHHQNNRIRVVLVGPVASTELVRKGLMLANYPPVEVRGVFSDPVKALKFIKSKRSIHQIIYTGVNLHTQECQQLIDYAEEKDLIFKFAPDLFHLGQARTNFQDLAGIPLIEIKSTSLDEWSLIVKRFFDFFLSSLALIILSPLMLLTALAIRLDSKGTILYRDTRVGKNGKEFQLVKFRSMKMMVKDGKMVHAKEDKEVEELKEKQKNYKLAHDPRITRVGSFIRKTSIDELPQFWNVLRGELSLVGPRAYRMNELELQQERYPSAKKLVRRLLTVKPGVTGVWQVSGRSEVEFTERVAMDAYYATHANLIMDFKLLLRTIPAVLKGSGAM